MKIIVKGEYKEKVSTTTNEIVKFSFEMDVIYRKDFPNYPIADYTEVEEVMTQHSVDWSTVVKAGCIVAIIGLSILAAPEVAVGVGSLAGLSLI